MELVDQGSERSDLAGGRVQLDFAAAGRHGIRPHLQSASLDGVGLGADTGGIAGLQRVLQLVQPPRGIVLEDGDDLGDEHLIARAHQRAKRIGKGPCRALYIHAPVSPESALSGNLVFS